MPPIMQHSLNETLLLPTKYEYDGWPLETPFNSSSLSETLILIRKNVQVLIANWHTMTQSKKIALPLNVSICAGGKPRYTLVGC